MNKQELSIQEKLPLLQKELRFAYSRSSGPGGQRVNKVNSRAELRFDLWGSPLLTDEQKGQLTQRLQGRITRQGELVLTCDQSRSRHQNQQTCLNRFQMLLVTASAEQTPRRPTSPGPTARKRRLARKQRLSAKKQLRRSPTEE